jgi:hypothetical protein
VGAADRIAETILRQGQIQAEGLNRSAEIQARAQQNNAQIWGGALQSLGQIPGEIAKYKLADTENKVRQAQLAEHQKQQDDQFNANQIFQFTTRPDPDGTVKLDDEKLNAMMQKAQGANIDFETQSRMSNAFKQMNADGDTFRQQQLAHQVKVAQNVMSMVKPGEQLTPGVALAVLKLGQANGWATAADTEQFLGAVNQGHDPAQLFAAIIKNGQGPQKPITNETELAIAAHGGDLPAAMNQLKPPPKPEAAKPFTNEIELRQDAATQGTSAETPTAWQSVETLRQIDEAKAKAPAAGKSLQRESVLLDGKPAIVQVDPDPNATNKVFDLEGKPIANAGTRVKPMPPASVVYPKPESGQQPEIQLKPDTQMYRVAQDIAYGKLTMADFNRIYGRAMGNASTKVAIYDTARKLNPDFDPSKFELGFKLAGNPAIRQRLVAIDSLGPVIDKIEGLAQQADLTNVPALNKLLSAGKFAIGDKTITNYRQLQTLLGDEVGNALGVGSGSDLKTRLGLDLVNPNLGPQQFIASMEQIRSVLGARKETLLKQFGPYAGAAGGNAPAAAPATPAQAPQAPAGWKYVPKAGGGWTAVPAQ